MPISDKKFLEILFIYYLLLQVKKKNCFPHSLNGNTFKILHHIQLKKEVQKNRNIKKKIEAWKESFPGSNFF